MSRREKNIKYQKMQKTSNEQEIAGVPNKTNQSINTDSYEYYSQRITSENNVTDSDRNQIQESSSNIQTNIQRRKVLPAKTQNIQKSELNCTCVKNELKCTCGKKELKCTCPKVTEGKCTCGIINKKNFEQEKYQYSMQQEKKNLCSTRYAGNSNIVIKEEVNISKEKSCTCPKKKKVVKKNVIIEKSKTEDKISQNINQKTTIEESWGKVCVGQNNENLQIIASEPPELIAQCVHDMQVIQEKKPVKILLPIKPTEIGQTQEVELKGREKDPNCGENIDTLFFSKAYETNMTNIPKFENLNVEKNEVTCKKKKKPKKILAIENEEMKVLVDRNFNKKNQTVVETKMNVYGIEKPCWNELNEAIKTTKMNIKEDYKSYYTNKDISIAPNDKMDYPAKYPRDDWNETALPMSGKPFTIKNTVIPEVEEETWNDKVEEKKEINIKMTVDVKKPKYYKGHLRPILLKAQEIDWNDTNKEHNDANIMLESTTKKNNFVFSKENEVFLQNEKEEIIVNDDYNIVEENYTRPIRANIKKIPDVSEESMCSEYDVLKGIPKYDGQNYLYKNIVSESVKINGQNIIINDISGQYPMKIETYQGTRENFEKMKNDQSYTKFNLHRKTEAKVLKKEVHYSRIQQNASKESEDIPVSTQNRKIIFKIERKADHSQNPSVETDQEIQNEKYRQKMIQHEQEEEQSDKYMNAQYKQKIIQVTKNEIKKEEEAEQLEQGSMHKEESEEEKMSQKHLEENVEMLESPKIEKVETKEKIEESPKSNKIEKEEEIEHVEEKEQVVVNAQEPENEQKEEQIEQKAIIKEIPYNKQVRYITLNKYEGQEMEENGEEQNQPQEEVEKKSVEEQKIEKVEEQKIEKEEEHIEKVEEPKIEKEEEPQPIEKVEDKEEEKHIEKVEEPKIEKEEEQHIEVKEEKVELNAPKEENQEEPQDGPQDEQENQIKEKTQEIPQEQAHPLGQIEPVPQSDIQIGQENENINEDVQIQQENHEEAQEKMNEAENETQNQEQKMENQIENQENIEIQKEEVENAAEENVTENEKIEQNVEEPKKEIKAQIKEVEVEPHQEEKEKVEIHEQAAQGNVEMHQEEEIHKIEIEQKNETNSVESSPRDENMPQNAEKEEEAEAQNLEEIHGANQNQQENEAEMNQNDNESIPQDERGPEDEVPNDEKVTHENEESKKGINVNIEINNQKENPMMYSFGGFSTGSNQIVNSGKKIITQVVERSNNLMEEEGKKTIRRTGNFGEIISGTCYYFSNTSSSHKRQSYKEPMDGQSKRNTIQNEKRESKGTMRPEPRDSIRKQ